jgi:tRNA(Ile2) C34 agmatinyltransferase TiaS
MMTGLDNWETDLNPSCKFCHDVLIQTEDGANLMCQACGRRILSRTIVKICSEIKTGREDPDSMVTLRTRRLLTILVGYMGLLATTD